MANDSVIYPQFWPLFLYIYIRLCGCVVVDVEPHHLRCKLTTINNIQHSPFYSYKFYQPMISASNKSQNILLILVNKKLFFFAKSL